MLELKKVFEGKQKWTPISAIVYIRRRARASSFVHDVNATWS